MRPQAIQREAVGESGALEGRADRDPAQTGRVPSEPLRILHVLNHTHRLNGNVHAAVDLACAQAALGHRVTVCSASGDFDALMAAHGVESVRIPQGRRPVAALRTTVALARLLRERRIDVAHAHMVASALLVRPGCALARIPLVTTVHNAFQRSAVLMAVGTRVVAVSAAVAVSMARRGVPERRLRVVLNGTIGAARFAHRDWTPERLPSPSILFVGGLHPRKGVADLLHAFACVHAANGAARLTLAGEGPYLEEYRALAAGMACAAAVTFTGAVADPRALLQAADIFVLPSHADPAPLVLSEAREAGCAVVASAVDGIPELLEHGRAGILVPPGNPARLAAALLPLVNDPAERDRWRANSQIDLARMAVSRVAQDTLAIYADCLNPIRAPRRLCATEGAPGLPALPSAGRPEAAGRNATLRSPPGSPR